MCVKPKMSPLYHHGKRVECKSEKECQNLIQNECHGLIFQLTFYQLNARTLLIKTHLKSVKRSEFHSFYLKLKE